MLACALFGLDFFVYQSQQTEPVGLAFLLYIGINFAS